MANTLQDACRKIVQEHRRNTDCALTEHDMYLQRIRDYNHPDPRPVNRTPCPVCGGRDNWIMNGKGNKIHLGAFMMVIAPGGQSAKYHHGLLVPCPYCNQETTTFNINAWWDEALPEVQQEYSRAVNERNGGGYNATIQSDP